MGVIGFSRMSGQYIALLRRGQRWGSNGFYCQILNGGKHNNAISWLKEKNMDSQKDATENLGSSRCPVAYWSDALEVVEAMQQEEPQICFIDGYTLTGKEAWDKCLRVVLQRLQAKAAIKRSFED